MCINIFLNRPFQASFSFIFVFSIQLKFMINFDDDWIRPRYQKRQLYQRATTTARIQPIIIFGHKPIYDGIVLSQITLLGNHYLPNKQENMLIFVCMLLNQNQPNLIPLWYLLKNHRYIIMKMIIWVLQSSV